MQKHNTRLPSLVLSTTVALIGAIVVVSIAFADESQSKSKLQSKSHHLNTLETVKQPTPPVIFPTSQQITPAVADGVDTAANGMKLDIPRLHQKILAGGSIFSW
jgi:hypothetical protein